MAELFGRRDAFAKRKVRPRGEWGETNVYRKCRKLTRVLLELRSVGDGMFEVLYCGEVLCCSSDPVVAGCSELLARGYSAWSVVEVRERGRAGYLLRSRIGCGAEGKAGRKEAKPVDWDAVRARQARALACQKELAAAPIAADPQNAFTVFFAPGLTIRVLTGGSGDG